MDIDEKFIFIDENNVEKEFVLVTSFSSEVTNQKYVVGFEEKEQSTSDYELTPFILNETTNELLLVESQSDLDEVQRVLDQIIKGVKYDE